MSEKLIPCPICGSKNTVRLPYNDRADIERCKNCNLTIIVPFGYTMWNTRPIEDELRARIAELEADNKKTFDLVRKLRMYCIWANWDNPDTEDEFNEFDVEVCKWLSKFMEREE